MTERQTLEKLLRDAEGLVATIKARLAEQLAEDSPSGAVSASASDAIERVQSMKTPDDTGNW